MSRISGPPRGRTVVVSSGNVKGRFLLINTCLVPATLQVSGTPASDADKEPLHELTAVSRNPGAAWGAGHPGPPGQGQRLTAVRMAGPATPQSTALFRAQSDFFCRGQRPIVRARGVPADSLGPACLIVLLIPGRGRGGEVKGTAGSRRPSGQGNKRCPFQSRCFPSLCRSQSAKAPPEGLLLEFDYSGTCSCPQTASDHPAALEEILFRGDCIFKPPATPTGLAKEMLLASWEVRRPGGGVRGWGRGPGSTALGTENPASGNILSLSGLWPPHL